MSSVSTAERRPALRRPQLGSPPALKPAATIDRLGIVAATGLCLLGLLVRLGAARSQGLWLDESTGLAAAIEPKLPQAILTAVLHDTRPPLYHMALWAWMHVSASVDAARWLSVVAGAGAVGLAISLSWSLWGRRAALITGLLGALSPWHVYYSAEIRMYGLESFLGILSLWFLWRCITRGGRARWMLYVITAVAFAWTDLYASLGLVGEAAWLFVRFRSDPQWHRARLALTVIVVGTLPLGLLAVGQLARNPGTAVHSGALRALTLMADIGAGFIAPAPVQLVAVFSVLLLGLLAAGLVSRDPNLSFVGAYLFTPVVVVFVAALIAPLWSERTLLFVTPAAWMLVGGLVSGRNLSGHLLRKIAIIATASLCAAEALALLAQMADSNAAHQRPPSLAAYRFVASRPAAERFLNVDNFTAAPFEVREAMGHRPDRQWELAATRNPGVDALQHSWFLKPFGRLLISASQGLAWNPGSRRVTYAELPQWFDQGPDFWLVYLEDPGAVVSGPLARLDVRLSDRVPMRRSLSSLEALIPPEFAAADRVDIDGTIFVHYRKSGSPAAS